MLQSKYTNSISAISDGKYNTSGTIFIIHSRHWIKVSTCHDVVVWRKAWKSWVLSTLVFKINFLPIYLGQLHTPIENQGTWCVCWLDEGNGIKQSCLYYPWLYIGVWREGEREREGQQIIQSNANPLKIIGRTKRKGTLQRSCRLRSLLWSMHSHNRCYAMQVHQVRCSTTIMEWYIKITDTTEINVINCQWCNCTDQTVNWLTHRSKLARQLYSLFANHLHLLSVHLYM